MFLTLALLGIIRLLIWKFLEEDENPLDKLPGPPRYPIIGCALVYLGMTPGDLFQKILQFNKLYGDRYVTRLLNRWILHSSNVNDIEIILSHSRNIKKSKPYKFMESWLGTGLLLSSGAKWHGRRKILTPTFYFNILKNFAVVMQENSEILVEKLKKFDGTKVNLLPIISDFTLLTICETAMGTQLGVDQTQSKLQYKGTITEIGSILLSRMTKVWLFNEYLFRKLPIGRKFEKFLQQSRSFTDNVIMDRKKNWKPGQMSSTEDNLVGEKKRLAMLDLLLEAESKGEIDLEGIREEVNTFMFEGHDTTAMALVFGLMLIADHEEVQDKIYEECQKIIGDSDRTLTLSDLAQMKYLEAVIKETLRLYPSVPYIAREITEDVTLGDLPLKKGTEVAIFIYELHHRADLFPEPDAFKPERFLSGEPMRPYAFIPFSAGPRNCIGQRFAMLEMKYALSGICRNFKLSPLVKGARPMLTSDMLIRPVGDVYVKFNKR